MDSTLATETPDRQTRERLLADLVALRKANELRQVDVAEKMNIGQPSVSELERGETSPRIETLQRYARAVGAELEFTIREEVNGDDQ